ncbi:MAG: T9SS type A sorting domain-containing protein, partial [Bacteroidota bacterium]
PTSIDFYIQGTAAASACNTVDEEVRWRLTDLVNTQATGNSLVKIQSGNAWNGGAASWNTVANNGYFQFTATETNTERMVGLSTTNANADWTSIQYVVYLRSNAQWEVRQSGSGTLFLGSYAANDVFRIAVEANVVKYYQNGVLRYISEVTPTLPLLVDVSINSLNGTVTNAIVSNFNTGTFTATATNAGVTPAYQWKLNGANVGTNSVTYTNTALNNNDVVTCVLTPDLGGCSLITYTSNAITNKAVPAPTSIDFYLAGTISTAACTEAIEQVVWKISDLVNNQASGNNLVKVQSNGAWDGGAASWNTVSNNGYFQFTATEVNTFRMAGLSTANANANFTSIQFAVYLRGDGQWEIYESGTGRGAFGAYAANDVFKIAVEANVVKYYRNGVIFFTSAVAPTLPLIADVSINSVGGTITNALTVNNSNAGFFTATATNAGANPTYTWRVNGTIVQTGTGNTYTNPSLVPGDVVLCQLTPNLGGCFSTIYTSNSITINGPGATRTWTGASNSNWYNTGNWSGGVIPDRFTSVTIPSGTPNALSLTSDASVYDITINAGANFTISGSNRLFVYRNFNNNGTFTANTSTIQFVGCSNAGTLSCSGTQTLYNVVINSPFGLTIASGTHQISNNFTFTNGIVNQNATLLFLAGSSSTGAKSSSYVNGPVRKAGTTAFVFPTGDATRFARIGIGAPSASTTFTAQYFSTPFGTYTNAATPTPVFNNVSAKEYWTLNQTVGSGNATVTLYWEDSQFSQINDCGTTDLRIARFNGTAWQNNNNAVSTTGACSLSSALAGTVSTTAVVTQFGPLTFGSLSNSVNPLPIVLKTFNASLGGSTSVWLNWVTSSELNNDYFEVQRSLDGESFEKIAIVKGKGTTTLENNYQLNDKRPTRGVNYYRLKQVDFDGKYTYSYVVSVEVDFDAQVFITEIFPNPADSENINARVESSNQDEPVRLRIFDQLGKLMFSTTVEKPQGQRFEIKLNNKLAAGLYIATFEQGIKRETIRLIIKD